MQKTFGFWETFPTAQDNLIRMWNQEKPILEASEIARKLTQQYGVQMTADGILGKIHRLRIAGVPLVRRHSNTPGRITLPPLRRGS